MMSANSLNHPALARKQADRRESGIALVTALVLLLLLSGLIVAMIYSLRGDLLVNGYYRNFRGSFYAADSGLNVVREDFNNQLTAILNANVAASGGTLPQGTPPLSPANGGAAGVLQTITDTYTPSYTLAGNGAQGTSSSTAASSWPESFKLDPNQAPTFAFISCSAFINNGNTPVGGANCSNLAGTNPDTYVYQYSYTLAVVGTSQGNQQTRLTDEGALTYTVKTKPSGGAPTVTSFAAWGMFIDQQTACQNGDLVPGTISGPVFTNGAWTFGNFSTKYVFTDNVGQAGANTGYDFGSNGCDQQNANSDTKSGVTIAPTFNQGFNRSQPSVPLPQNHFNQEQAVLDGIGMANSAPPTSALNTVLKNAAGTSYPSGGASSGVYLPF
jgi:hypothetical protein